MAVYRHISLPLFSGVHLVEAACVLNDDWETVVAMALLARGKWGHIVSLAIC